MSLVPGVWPEYRRSGLHRACRKGDCIGLGVRECALVQDIGLLSSSSSFSLSSSSSSPRLLGACSEAFISFIRPSEGSSSLITVNTVTRQLPDSPLVSTCLLSSRLQCPLDSPSPPKCVADTPNLRGVGTPSSYPQTHFCPIFPMAAQGTQLLPPES